MRTNRYSTDDWFDVLDELSRAPTMQMTAIVNEAKLVEDHIAEQRDLPPVPPPPPEYPRGPRRHRTLLMPVSKEWLDEMRRAQMRTRRTS